MDRDDRPGRLFYRFSQQLRVHGVEPVVRINEHWACSTQTYGLGRSDEGVGYRDDFVVFAYPERKQRQPQRFGAASYRDAEAAAAVLSKCLLELLHEFSACKGACVDHALECRIDLAFDGQVLCFQIQERDCHG